MNMFLQGSMGILFLTLVFLHVGKKNAGSIHAYAIQSLAIVALIVCESILTKNTSLLLVALFAFFVKVCIAPFFFKKLIRTYHMTFSANTFLTMPLALIGIALLAMVAYSQKLAPLTAIVPEHHTLLALALTCVFTSFFLIINRKGVLSQIIGILSLENSIVAFMLFAGLEQSFVLQLGTICTMVLWIGIASVFMTMIFKHFGSQDSTFMKQLHD